MRLKETIEDLYRDIDFGTDDIDPEDDEEHF